MKILNISTSDIQGGAARSAYRLHQGFRAINIDSQMLVKTKNCDDRFVFGKSANSGMGNAISGLRLSLEGLPLKLYRNRSKNYYSYPWVSDTLKKKIGQINPDIINLHWVSAGYLNIESIAKFNKPIFWTLHDMWAFTGGCHYNQECDRYTSSCGVCPALGSKSDWDLSRLLWHRKIAAWKNLNLTVVTPSKWLAECAKKSSIFKNCRVEVIPYGLDTQKYKPIDKKTARKLLNLPQDKQLLLFGALQASGDQRKGFHLLQPALHDLAISGWKDKLELVIFGTSTVEKSTNFGLKSHSLGILNDDLTLALAYSAADVFIAPSVQDNLPNTVMESLACGTPCVAFNIGGMPDMIEHQVNGYLAKPFQVQDLVQGIIWTLENEERYQKISYYARQKSEKEFALTVQANSYCQIYNEVLTSR
jgi:glycosyltransferase involved in cell wall biosynthesis